MVVFTKTTVKHCIAMQSNAYRRHQPYCTAKQRNQFGDSDLIWFGLVRFGLIWFDLI